MTNFKLRLLGNLCWFVFALNYLWRHQLIPLFEKLAVPIILYILISIIMDIWIKVNNSRADKTGLHNSNIKFKSSVNKLLQLYHSIDFRQAQSNLPDITNRLCELTLEITEVEPTFAWIFPQEGVKSLFLMKPENKAFEEKITIELEQTWASLRNDEEATFVYLQDSRYYLAPVKTAKGFYGFIGILWNSRLPIESREGLLQNIKLVAECHAIIYERIQTESLTAKSAVEMEQKRIGEEIHDLISGRLFSAVCATSALMKSAKLNEKDKEQLRLIASTVNQSLGELRSIIYSLKASSNEQWFERHIKRYLDEFAKLHEVTVSLLINEEISSIGRHHARALFRIIQEAVHNAVEHGHCKNLSVEIINRQAEFRLAIIDDGTGFELNDHTRAHQGLGLANIANLANSINAILTIESHLGQRGTRIGLTVPKESAKITAEKTFGEVVS